MPPTALAAKKRRRSEAQGQLLHLIMQHDVQEGTVHAQGAIVVQETQFPKLIHKEVDPGPCGTDHVSEHGLIHIRNGCLRLTLLSEIRQQ